ncbi:MAG: flavodoxin family protein, partial [Clostridia bacterium]|nr:flavodoxin family protein [Clostridia bacterium]
MKKIVAINASPRTAWNTSALVRAAAKGAEENGAEVVVFDLYKLEKFTGCISCFGCKLPANLGKCV